MSKANDNVKDLLAAINMKTAQSDDTAPAIETERKSGPPSKSNKVAEPAKRPSNKKSKAGKPVQFWMHDEDRRLVREFSAWLAGQGVRPSDSMVIRAALRYAKTGSAFLQAYREASKLDGRLNEFGPV